MNVGNTYDTSVKTSPLSEAGLFSFDGYFGYILAFVCYAAYTQTFDLIKRNLPDWSCSRNMNSHRLIDTDRQVSKICLKPCETEIYIQARRAILYRINQYLVGLAHKVYLDPQGWKILKLRPTWYLP